MGYHGGIEKDNDNDEYSSTSNSNILYTIKDKKGK